MYLRIPRNIHLELSNQCNIKCPMCRRNSIDGLHSVVGEAKQLTISDIKNSFDGIRIDKVRHCGSNGDPLMAKDALSIFKYFEGSEQLIHTNASLRSKSFWKELSSIKNLTVQFSIDGLTQNTLNQYRIGADIDKILSNAKTFIDGGGNAVWSMIKFEHNSHEILDAQKVASDMGFFAFDLTHTRRFFGNQKFTYTYNNKKFDLIKPDTVFEETLTKTNCINCVAKKNEEVYIDAGGFVWACTYLADSHFIRPNDELFNIRNRKYSDIIFDEFFDQLDDSFTKNPLDCCTLNCKINYRNKHERLIL